MQDERQLEMRVIYLEALVQRLSERYNDLCALYSAHTHTYNPTLTSTSVATSTQSQAAPVLVDENFTLNRLP